MSCPRCMADAQSALDAEGLRLCPLVECTAYIGGPPCLVCPHYQPSEAES